MDSILQIQELLQCFQLPDVKAISQHGDTVLHLVVKNMKFSSKKKIQILQVLLEQGVDFNTKNRNDETVLHLAMKDRARDIIDFLLTFKSVPETNFQNSVITCLIESERDKLLELENQHQMSDSELKKWENESITFVEWIMSKDLKIEASEKSPLFMAIKFGHQHMLPILFKYTIVIDKDKYLLQQFFRQFLQQNKSHKYRYEGKPCNIWFTSYFERHAKRFVNDLLDRGLSPDDPDENRTSVLSLAIELEEHLDIVKMLIDRSINIDSKNSFGEAAFYIVINRWIRLQKPNTNYYREIALALIDKGANINVQNNYQYSPLSNAILLNNLEVAKFLNECGVDFNVKMRMGRTLIHLLFERISGRESSVEVDIQLLNMLISQGCEVNAKDIYGLTPLHVAATKKGPLKVIQKLIEYKAGVNSPDNRGWRPLHYAVIHINTSIVDLLLKSGATINATTLAGNTPLNFAILAEKDAEQTPLFKILIQHGADLNEEFSTLSMDIKQRQSYDFRLGLVVVTESYVENQKEYLFKHWMKLKAANLKCVDNSGYEQHTHSKKYKELYKKYLLEIATLKRNFIDGPVSLYNFINMNSYRRCAYINNEILKNIIGDQVTLEKNFPEYSIIILGKYREALNKKSLMELTKEICLEMTNIVLPDLCLECIFSFV